MFEAPAPGQVPVDARIIVDPVYRTAPVGRQILVTVLVVDREGDPIPEFLVEGSVSGANPSWTYQNTGTHGLAYFSYTDYNPGEDVLTVRPHPAEEIQNVAPATAVMRRVVTNEGLGLPARVVWDNGMYSTAYSPGVLTAVDFTAYTDSGAVMAKGVPFSAEITGANGPKGFSGTLNDFGRGQVVYTPSQTGLDVISVTIGTLRSSTVRNYEFAGCDLDIDCEVPVPPVPTVAPSVPPVPTVAPSIPPVPTVSPSLPPTPTAPPLDNAGVPTYIAFDYFSYDNPMNVWTYQAFTVYDGTGERLMNKYSRYEAEVNGANGRKTFTGWLDQNGRGSFGYYGAKQGVDILTVRVDLAVGRARRSFGMTGLPGTGPIPTMIDISPDMSVRKRGTFVQMEALVLDQFGQPVPGVQVMFKNEGANPQQTNNWETTNGDGVAGHSYWGNNLGPDVVTVQALSHGGYARGKSFVTWVDPPGELPTPADDAPVCPEGESPFDAQDLPAIIPRECDFIGEIIHDTGPSLTVGPPGTGITAQKYLIDGRAAYSQSLRAETLMDGSVALVNVGDERYVGGVETPVGGERRLGEMSTQRLDRHVPSPTACADKEYNFAGAQENDAKRWFINAESIPDYLPVDRTVVAIRNGVRSITHGTTDCDTPYGDGIDARANWQGYTYREVDMNDGDTCQEYRDRDDYNVVDFGYLHWDPGSSTYDTPLAVACSWHFFGEMHETDIRATILERWILEVGPNCRSQLQDRFDLHGVMAHEWGHAYGLDHVSEHGHAFLTMSEKVDICTESQRTLGLGDLMGLEFQY